MDESSPVKQCSRCDAVLPMSRFRLKGNGRRRSECRECALLDHPDPRAEHLARYYKLTRDEYDALLAAQQGRCALCGTDEPRNRRGVFAVDHDHRCCPGSTTCGQCIRGLLCTRCNRLLGTVERLGIGAIEQYCSGRVARTTI